MIRRNALILSLLGGALFFVGQSMLQSCGPVDTRSDAERGAELYHSYCEICHGTGGDGPMENVLEVDVPNLTLLSQNNGGTFPRERLFDVLAGEGHLLQVGDSEMPVWGDVFMEGEDLNRRKQAREKIDEVIDYLEGIQQ